MLYLNHILKGVLEGYILSEELAMVANSDQIF